MSSESSYWGEVDDTTHGIEADKAHYHRTWRHDSKFGVEGHEITRGDGKTVKHNVNSTNDSLPERWEDDKTSGTYTKIGGDK